MDKERVNPVRMIVLHHSLGPTFKNLYELTIQDWFDNCGRGWGYKHYCDKYGYNINDYHTGHMHPARDKETFAQVQFALHEHSGSPTGWRLVLLMRDPYGCVAWGTDQVLGAKFHIGPINQESIQVECCGDYTSKELPDAALETIFNGFVNHVRELKASGYEFIVKGHRDFAATTCPGKIYNQLPELQSMFFNAQVK